MKDKKLWLAIAVAFIVVLGGGVYFANASKVAADSLQSAGASSVTGSLVTIQSASATASQVSAAGNIDLVDERYVAVEVGGVVDAVAIRAGDDVAAGDLLLTLNTTSLERAARQAELAVQSQRNLLDQLMESADAAEIEAAEAELLEAKEDLADVLAGPTDGEIAAANSNLSAAVAAYNELRAGPSADELTQLQADLRVAEIAVAEAQNAYDQIAWQNSAGMTSEAAELQSATIEYESARAAYAESTAAADESELQSAVNAIQEAQNTLDDLQNSPTQAEIASANAAVATAQANLDTLIAGATDSEVEEIQIALEQSLIDLEQAYADLEAANVVAPIAGMVLAIDASVGENVSEGAQIVTLADTNQLELTIEVAEVDISQVSVGQPAVVEIDAFPGNAYSGEVSHIEPASDDSSGTVTYPVTIHLTDDNLDDILPGMTAVATITYADDGSASGWMVPTSAIQSLGDASVVTVVRGDSSIQTQVTTGAIQGEWTVVQSSELQAGDQVYGTLTSTVDDEEQMGGPGGGSILGGGMTGGGGPPAGGGSPPAGGGGPPGN